MPGFGTEKANEEKISLQDTNEVLKEILDKEVDRVMDSIKNNLLSGELTKAHESSIKVTKEVKEMGEKIDINATINPDTFNVMIKTIKPLKISGPDKIKIEEDTSKIIPKRIDDIDKQKINLKKRYEN